jgi:ubiquinone/menaquinone biosynthesis C-methylase UbiE
VHCVAHKTNLVAFTFSNLPIVGKIEALLASVYTYFNHSPKRKLERSKLVEIMETKGFKMVENVVVNESVAANYELLCYIETIVGLTCLLLMLEALQDLNKYV